MTEDKKKRQVRKGQNPFTQAVGRLKNHRNVDLPTDELIAEIRGPVDLPSDDNSD